MKVLVVGGTQFNGLALVRELVRTGHDVHVLNRGNQLDVLPPGVASLIADRTDSEAVARALGDRDFDCVFDMCAYRPEEVGAMADLLHGRVGHYVFASSTVIYAPSHRLPITEDHPVDRGPDQNEYGLNKLLCEDRLVRAHRERGFPATVAALTMVFGPRNILPEREQRMFVRLRDRRPVLVPGDGTTVGQVIPVEDEARALVSMMQVPRTFGRRYNVAGVDCFTDHGYVDTLAEVVGVEPEKVSIPPAIMDRIYDGRIPLGDRPVRSLADVRTRQGDRATSRFQMNRLMQRLAPNLHPWNRSLFFTTARLREDTGWRPEIPLRSAAESTWAWMRAEGLDRRLEFDFAFEDRLLEQVRAAQ